MKIINDAAMQALGSYKGGKMLYVGLGAGLGSTMIVDSIVEPMELAHLPYRKGTYEDYVDIVLGGGNASTLKDLPPGCRPGDNANACLGGFRL